MKTTANKVWFKLSRQSSPYNPSLKWHVEYYRENKTLLASQYFKTRKEAQANIDCTIEQGIAGFPIGDRLPYTTYEQLP